MRSKTFQVWGTISWWIAHSYLCPRKFLSDRPCRGKHLAHCSQWNPIPAASKQVPLDTISLWVSPGTWQTKKPTRTEKQMMKVNIQHSRHSHGIHRGSLWHHLAALWGLKDLTTPVRAMALATEITGTLSPKLANGLVDWSKHSLNELDLHLQ